MKTPELETIIRRPLTSIQVVCSVLSTVALFNQQEMNNGCEAF
jgi:hypothetical protein